MFNIDFEILVRYLTPVILRKIKILAWLKVLVSQVKYLYDLFIVYRTSSNYRVQHNGQTCYLRKVLNDQFDNTLRRIDIIAGTGGNVIYLITSSPIFLETISPIIYLVDSEGDDFTIECPNTLSGSEDGIITLADNYKLPGKTYNITYV